MSTALIRWGPVLVALVFPWAAAWAQAADSSARPVPSARVSAWCCPAAARAARRTSACSRCWKRLRVPVDCIAGASMGAIVGGSYASGMGSAQMLEQMAQITSERLFNDRPPRSDEPMRIKSQGWQPLAAPEFGFNDGNVTTPKGVVNGVALEAELRRLVKVRERAALRPPADPLPRRGHQPGRRPDGGAATTACCPAPCAPAWRCRRWWRR